MSEIGRPIGTVTRRYRVTAKQRARLIEKASKLKGLQRAVILDRILSSSPLTLEKLAARFQRSKSMVARAEAQALADASARKAA